MEIESMTSVSPSQRAVSSRSEEHTSELQSPCNLVCRLLLEKTKYNSVDFFFFFFNDTATTEIYTLSLHDALPIYRELVFHVVQRGAPNTLDHVQLVAVEPSVTNPGALVDGDRVDDERVAFPARGFVEIGRAHV